MCDLLSLEDHGITNDSNIGLKVTPGLLGGADKPKEGENEKTTSGDPATTQSDHDAHEGPSLTTASGSNNEDANQKEATVLNQEQQRDLDAHEGASLTSASGSNNDDMSPNEAAVVDQEHLPLCDEGASTVIRGHRTKGGAISISDIEKSTVTPSANMAAESIGHDCKHNTAKGNFLFSFLKICSDFVN